MLLSLLAFTVFLSHFLKANIPITVYLLTFAVCFIPLCFTYFACLLDFHFILSLVIFFKYNFSCHFMFLFMLTSALIVYIPLFIYFIFICFINLFIYLSLRLMSRFISSSLIIFDKIVR